MTRTTWRRVGLGVAVLTVALAGTVGPTLAFHFLPAEWTGEDERLAQTLGLRAGSVVADIGAGDGEMALALARRVAPSGIVYATEMTEKQRAGISEAASDASATNVRVVAAAERATGLPDACCDAIYLRNVLHHIGDREAFARDLRRALRPGGRLAVIDFGPDTFFHLAGNHGVDPDTVAAALGSAGLRVGRRGEDWGGGLFLVTATR